MVQDGGKTCINPKARSTHVLLRAQKENYVAVILKGPREG